MRLNNTEPHELFMSEALGLAAEAAAEGEVPVGALLVRDGLVIGRGANKPIGACDPSAHAEILALREAAAGERNYRLPGTTLYVTIEPCAMCLGAIVHARVSTVVFGAREPKAGMLVSNTGWVGDACFNHHFEVVEGVLADECSGAISRFFQQRRALKAQLKGLKDRAEPRSFPD